MRVALLFEHPTWSIELLSRLRRRGVDVTPIDVGTLDPGGPQPGEAFDVWVNRVNIMPSTDCPPTIVAATSHLLLSLDAAGQRVFNGARAHAIGGSKIAQASLVDRLGLEGPASLGITDPNQAGSAASQLGFPVLTKPNIGGSGSGIARYDDAEQLDTAVASGRVDLGIDGTGIVQKVVESSDGHVHRIEMLTGNLLYATRQPIRPGAFNYCAADGCAFEEWALEGGAVGVAGPPIEVVDPEPTVVAQVHRIVEGAGADAGGVEYLIDASTGRPRFHDFNPYSNFLTGQNDVLGFDPIDRYIDAVLSCV